MLRLNIAFIFLACVIGCSSSTSRPSTEDGGVTPRDSSTPSDGSTISCTETNPSDCVMGTRGGGCGDAALMRVCTDGVWTCPAGTIPLSECACVGRPPPGCSCGASGWECTGGCPIDLESAIGTECAVEGATCGGGCTDVCEACNLIACRGGIWQRQEVFPDPTCAESFACGPMRCTRRVEYCRVSHSDVGGEPDSYDCVALPEGCTSFDCSCFVDIYPASFCSDAGDAALTIDIPGG